MVHVRIRARARAEIAEAFDWYHDRSEMAAPITRAIALQGLAPDTPQRRAWTDRLLAKRA